MRDVEVAERAKGLGIRSIPAVVIEGKLAGCCAGGGVDEAILRAAGLGTPGVAASVGAPACPALTLVLPPRFKLTVEAAPCSPSASSLTAPASVATRYAITSGRV